MGRFWRKLRQISADDRVVASLAKRLNGLRQLTQAVETLGKASGDSVAMDNLAQLSPKTT